MGNIIKQLLFPEKCKCCGKLADFDNLCSECREQISKDKITSEILPLDLKLVLVDKIYSAYYYQNSAKQALLNAKFKNPASFLNSFINDVGANVQSILTDNNVDLIISAPFYKTKMYNSEFDLPYEMAKRISRFTGLKHSDCVKKIRKTDKQHSLSLEKRKVNLVNAFEVTGDVAGKNILLIDDVLTTGVTVSTIAKELKLAGCKSVIVWTYTFNTYERNK